jgi:hypothetical protein
VSARPPIIVCPREGDLSEHEREIWASAIQDFLCGHIGRLVFPVPVDVFALNDGHWEKLGNPNATKAISASPIAHCHDGPDYGPNAVFLKPNTEKPA